MISGKRRHDELERNTEKEDQEAKQAQQHDEMLAEGKDTDQAEEEGGGEEEEGEDEEDEEGEDIYAAMLKAPTGAYTPRHELFKWAPQLVGLCNFFLW